MGVVRIGLAVYVCEVGQDTSPDCQANSPGSWTVFCSKKKSLFFFYTIPFLLNGLLWDFLPQIYTLLFHSWGEESSWICIKKAKWDSNSRKSLRRVISGAELVAKHWVVFYFLRNILLLLLLNPGKPLATTSPRRAQVLCAPGQCGCCHLQGAQSGTITVPFSALPGLPPIPLRCQQVGIH